MIKRLADRVFSALFLNTSSHELSLASSLGLLVGLLPLYGFRTLIIFALSLCLNLNIIALFIGLCGAVLCPLLFTALSWSLDKFDNIEAVSFMSYDLYKGNFSLVFSLVVGILFTLSFYNVFKLLYGQTSSHSYSNNRLSIASSMGMLMGILSFSEVNLTFMLILTISLILVFRLNILAALAGAFVGISIFHPLLSMVLFWYNNGFSGNSLALFLSGHQSAADFIQFIRNQQYEYLFVLLISILVSFASYSVFMGIYTCKDSLYNISAKNYVFQDSSGRRWSKIKRATSLLITSFIVITTLFCSSLALNIPFPGTNASTGANEAEPALNDKTLLGTMESASGVKREENRKRTFCFYVGWDPKSKLSFKRNIDSIDVLIPGWYQLTDRMSVVGSVDTEINELALQNGVKVMPLVNNFNNNKWDKDLLHRMLSSESYRKSVISSLISEAKKYNFAGINIDFENLDEEYRDYFTLFISELYTTFYNEGLEVIVDVPPAQSAYDYSKLSKFCNYLILMAYDEHAATSKPGPIASRQWFEDSLKNSGIPSDKLVVGLGSYGYDWINSSKDEALGLTLSEVMKLAVSYNAKINWDKQYSNPYLTYTDGKKEHTLWFIDSTVLYNQMLYSQKLGLDKFAVWRLGSEDSSFWTLIKNLDKLDQSRGDLDTMSNSFDSGYSQTDLISSHSTPQNIANRKLEFSSDGFISNAAYELLPSVSGLYGDKRIALTFDDGPNPKYTPQILDILKRSNIKATFLVTGKKAQAYPEIIKRIYSEGHDIGSHTYSHVNLLKTSELRTRFEINTTQRIIEMLTGHSTILFRKPYDDDFSYTSPGEIDIYERINKMGYLLVGSSIDPKDREASSPSELVDRIDSRLGSGNTVLLHDDGDYVNNTVEALPQIIESAKSKGYSFVTVSNLYNRNRKDVMPSISTSQSAFLMAVSFVLYIFARFKLLVTYIFLFATSIGIVRFIFLIFFSKKQVKKYRRKIFWNDYKPMVSVVVAAYNEEKVICKTVDSILESNYDNLEVIVVNDGSKDNTAKVVTESFYNNRKVRLITKENGGKSSAVNRGFMEARGEIVVVIDADTLLANDAVSLMVRHFENENVAAVSGNVKVGNTNNLLTLWQHIEYVTGLNLERRAFDELNCIPVVPGAIGAWRKDLVASVGYYNEDTLAEDADITLTFLKQGYKIVYEEGARAYTEAPEDLVSFLKQRLRWSYGTLQCLWKHRSSLFNPKHKRVGFITLPYMWLYQFLFQTVSPLTEVLFILGLLGSNPSASIIMYLTFFIIDFVITLYAFSLEKESPRPLLWLFLQRIIYRQLMTYVVYKSLLSALKGVKVGWNKLKRKGNVENPVQNPAHIKLKGLSA
ncbi:MAG: glycosyltransferase [Bacillota bacterium]